MTTDQLSDHQSAGAGSGPAVTVRDLEISTTNGTVVVHDVSFEIAPGEVLGVVGESGSGKTTIGLSLLGHARRGLEITDGTILLGDQDIRAMGDSELRRLRGSLVSYVPQDPASSLNPALRIGTQLREVLEAHGETDGKKNAARIAEMMREVALSDDPAYLKRYPHQLSGGQQQRVGLAMAFANRPRLIVLDEPTTGLDVTTQSTVLATVRDLAAAHGVAALYVTHDLAVVAAVATRVAVMYAGRIVELGPADKLFESSGAPLHPPTRRRHPAPGRWPQPGRHPGARALAGQATARLRLRATLRLAHRRVRPPGPRHARARRPTTSPGASRRPRCSPTSRPSTATRSSSRPRGSRHRPSSSRTSWASTERPRCCTRST